MTSTPTPSGTPTQIYVRFDTAIKDGMVHASIGCDGEETAPPEIRLAMADIARAVSLLFLFRKDGDASLAAERLASILDGMGEPE